MKGIILAAGTGSRLFPITKCICKPLVPVFDKPMVFYPLGVMMELKIKDVLIITAEDQKENFEKVLGNGSHLGMNISFIVQKEAKGTAQALLLGEQFAGNDSVCLMFGDNFLCMEDAFNVFKTAMQIKHGCHLCTKAVENPKDFGVVVINKNNIVENIQEKPLQPKSNQAIVGIYFFDSNAISYAKQITPSSRGELEISSVVNMYVQNSSCSATTLSNNAFWLDTGTIERLHEASNHICKMNKQNKHYGCLELIATSNGWITKTQAKQLAQPLMKTEYGETILKNLK